jgi:GT2 family glycosyltransferase
LEIIVVDNASTDDTLELIEQSLPMASILSLAQNRGYGGGCNEGARVARGEILMFMNQDVAVSTDFLNGVVSVLDGDDRIGICGGTVLSWDGTMLVSLGQVFERWTGYGLDIGFGLYRPELNRDVGEVFSPNGSAFVVRRSVFREIGGFDESLFMYFDETDLSWRARLAGFRVACSRGSVVRHMITPQRAHRPSSRYYIDRNSLLSAARNYQFSNLIRFLPTSIACRLAAIALFTVFGRHELARSTSRALVDFITRLPTTWRERRALSKIRRVSDAEVMRREVLARPSDILAVFSSSLMPHTRE